MLNYCYKAYEKGINKKVIDMSINGSGIRDTARVLNISKNTVVARLKKKKSVSFMLIQTFTPVVQKMSQK